VALKFTNAIKARTLLKSHICISPHYNMHIHHLHRASKNWIPMINMTTSPVYNIY